MCVCARVCTRACACACGLITYFTAPDPLGRALIFGWQSLTRRGTPLQNTTLHAHSCRPQIKVHLAGRFFKRPLRPARLRLRLHQAGCACRRGGSRNVPFATKRVPYSKPVRRASNSVKRYTDWVRSPTAIQLQARLTIAAPNKHHGSSAKYGRVHELECGTAQRKVVPSARKAAPFLVPKNGT